MKQCKSCQHAKPMPMQTLLICGRIKTFLKNPLDDACLGTEDEDTVLFISPWFGCILHEERRGKEDAEAD